MTALPARDPRDEPMTLAEFRAWHPAGEGRWELIDGVPVLMADPTPEHADIQMNLIEAILPHLRQHRPACRATTRGVERPATRRWLNDSYRIPDISVTCGPSRREARTPILVIEILSPSNARKLVDAKREFYGTIESIFEILEVEQDEAKATVWRRGGALWVPVQVGRDLGAAVALESIDLTLPLAAIYEDVDLPPIDLETDSP